MKSIIRKKNSMEDEKGAALIMALILLLIGGLISGALLNHMGSGILASQVHERRTAELYAADAGVEDAIWKIQHGETPVCPGDPYWSYNITDVNGKELQVSIEYLPDEGTYKITSIAITNGVGDGSIAAIDSATAVEAYVSVLYLDFSSLLDNAIVSYDTVKIQPNNVVNGDVWLPIADEEHLVNKGIINGTVKDEEDVELIWPTGEQLSNYYYDDVEGTYDPSPSINVEYTKTIGPCYRDGDLAVDNTGDPDTLVLEGTVYVTGNLEFRQAGSHIYTVDLNGYTIFAEGDIAFPSNAVSISGPGCIIAVDDIDFQPSITGDDFVLVMSIEGIVNFQPSGDFTGCIAGNVDVNLQPGNTIDWISPEGKGLNFPMGGSDDDESPPINRMNIESWEIIQQ